MAGVLTAGAALGVIFGLASFTFLQARQVDPLIGIPLSLMAFFFGFAVIGHVAAIAMVVARLISRRR